MRVSAWTSGQTDLRPSPEDLELIKRYSKHMHPLLFDLLSHGGPHPFEEMTRNTLLKFFKEKCELDISKESKNVVIDEFGNLHVDLRTDMALHKSMFSAHMDIIHGTKYDLLDIWITKDDAKKGTPGMVWGATRDYSYRLYSPKTGKEISINDICVQHNIKFWSLEFDETIKGPNKTIRVEIQKSKTEYSKSEPANIWAWGKKASFTPEPSTLGADDKVGCYIMSRMIEKNIPGYYVFHVGEEVGCKGSRWITDKLKDQFKNVMNKCVAFDRAGYTDVINSQHGTKRSSEEFSIALAKAINASPTIPPKSQYQPNVVGVHTDSAVYSDLIPECCNLSVGYFNQHGPGEHFDLDWLETMFIPAILDLEWDNLPIVRDPDKKITYSNHNTTDYNQQYNRNRMDFAGTPTAIDKITYATPYHMLPRWEPSDGLVKGATEDVMKRLIEAHMDKSLGAHRAKVNFVFELICQVADLGDHVIALRKKYGVVDEGAIPDAIVDPLDDPNGPMRETVVDQALKDAQIGDTQVRDTTFTALVRNMETCPCGERSDLQCPCSPEMRIANKEIADMKDADNMEMGLTPVTDVTEILADPEVKARLER